MKIVHLDFSIVTANNYYLLCRDNSIEQGMFYIGVLIYLAITYLIADKIGRHKKFGFTGTLIICGLLTPFIGLLISEGRLKVIPEAVSGAAIKRMKLNFVGYVVKTKKEI